MNSSLDKKQKTPRMTRKNSKNKLNKTLNLKHKTMGEFKNKNSLKKQPLSSKKIFKMDIGSSSSHLKKNEYEIPPIENNNSEFMFDKKIIRSNSIIKEMKNEDNLLDEQTKQNKNKELESQKKIKKNDFSFKKKKLSGKVKTELSKFGLKHKIFKSKKLVSINKQSKMKRFMIHKKSHTLTNTKLTMFEKQFREKRKSMSDSKTVKNIIKKGKEISK
jgi:hypothetical protein